MNSEDVAGDHQLFEDVALLNFLQRDAARVVDKRAQRRGGLQ